MILFAHLALVSWVVLGVALCARYPGPKRRVVIGLYVLGTLFLPELRSVASVPDMPAPISLPGFKLTKTNAIAVGLLLGSLLSDRGRWLGTRPRWFDLPMLAWCLSPFVSTVANSLLDGDAISRFDPEFVAGAGRIGVMVNWLEYSGLYDGVVTAVDNTLIWGVPYWLGRMYLADREGVEELLLGVVAGAVLYVPLCLLEARISPQLHLKVYGFHQHDFSQSIRLGGYRPTVFMEHGLAVGLYMVASALVALWLWFTGPLRSVPVPGTAHRVSGLWLVLALVGTAVACKSSGALALGMVGVVALVASRVTRWPVLVAALMCAPPLYVAVRTTGVWEGREVVDAVARNFDADRAASLEFRLKNEELLVDKALGRSLFGWGGWGRSRVYNADGEDQTVTDGLWIIALGERGFFGLLALGAVVLLPVARLIARDGTRPWVDRGSGFAGAAAVVLALYAIDCLMNAMVNPVFMLLAGGLTALTLAEPVVEAARATVAAAEPGTWRVRQLARKPDPEGPPTPKRAAPMRVRQLAIGPKTT